MARSAALPALKAESGLSHYLEEIRRFPMLEPQEEYMLARSWREHGDREAAHKLVTSHLRLVAKIAMGYRGYGLPISEVVSEGNVGLMQAVKRFEPEKGFRLATYAMWWIKAAIQEYILRSWSLVKMGTTANQKKLFFNLRKAKSKISALDEGDLRPDQVKVIAKRLGVNEKDVVDMNRRLGGDASLNAPIRDDGESGEWMDWLVDDAPSQERILADHEESDNRHQALTAALDVLNERERRIFEARRLADDPITLEDLGHRVRRLARARAPDRGARLRESAEGGEEQDRRHGAADGNAGSHRDGALSLRRDMQEFKWPGAIPAIFCRRHSGPPLCSRPFRFRPAAALVVNGELRRHLDGLRILWKLKMKNRAAARGVIETDFTAELRDNLLDHAEPKTEAALPARVRDIGPREPFEDARFEARRDAVAVIAHGDTDLAAAAADCNHNLAARRREFDRIGNKVSDDLVEPIRVAAYFIRC